MLISGKYKYFDRKVKEIDKKVNMGEFRIMDVCIDVALNTNQPNNLKTLQQWEN
jgi:hypothetical protein